MVTLINDGSVSGAELIAGALADNDRSILVGMTTKGKGTMQDIFELSDTRTLKLTTGLFYQPNGSSNQLIGIIPHFEVMPRGQGFDKNDVTREIDEGYNSFPKDGAPIHYPVSENLKSCLAENAKAEQEFWQKGIIMSHDYQFLFAKDVANCLIKSKSN